MVKGLNQILVDLREQAELAQGNGYQVGAEQEMKGLGKSFYNTFQ